MAKKLSIRTRLILLFVIPTLMYAGTSVYLLEQQNTNIDELTSSLYDTTGQATSIILNADRDMYQALTAYQYITSGVLSADEESVQMKVFTENIEQANERVGQALEIFTKKELLQTSHDDTNVTIEQNLSNFQTSFDQWAKDTNDIIQSGVVGEGVINNAQTLSTFEEGRSSLNQVGEILDTFAKSSIENINKSKSDNARAIYSGIVAAIVILGIAGTIVIRRIMKTIKKIIVITGQVAAGDLRHEIQTNYDNDELGKITESVDTMIVNIKGLIGTISSNTKFVLDASVELSDSSRESAKAAEHVTLNIQEMNQNVEVQARASEENSRAIEEMAIGIQRVAENSTVMADHSSLTSRNAELGNELLINLQHQIVNMIDSVEKLSDTVQSLTHKSDEIGNIAESITTFATQTNLLSLNASIEAARAGEHGKGFNVVANEIRKLASQSLESAEGINKLIHETRVEITSVSESMNRTKQEASAGSSMMEEVNQSFATIMESVAHVVTQIHETSAITEQMSASSEEISATMEHSAASSSQILMRSQTVAAATEEQLAMMQNIAASSEQLRSVVDTLNESVSYFKIK
ncbi:MAG: methyl-accepting chemotaxis protein [Candidatus Pristimantibacillus lignocellulolyticus]|uniref:Methyl-accepting chemotaxis protein n=1 Tax=Candidatus Pristimantibacillus lignocellulolyticus TaxID=2994561 RepID=A0A9J6ZAL7_9BACL|nr:MAG: methyl-accepting chemotaxis protein [Candidatus Pristimantibacillus lignocellulolyticus]